MLFSARQHDQTSNSLLGRASNTIIPSACRQPFSAHSPRQTAQLKPE
ncbi:hypothetical protein KXJ74_14185 [Acinetobacter johnsonii]|nr:hypothetical protein KXJ74_14185 [Acinetobacter johnsonii]